MDSMKIRGTAPTQLRKINFPSFNNTIKMYIK